MSIKTKAPTTRTVKLTQQSVNLVRQVVNGLGWIKTIEDIGLSVPMTAKGGTLEIGNLDWLQTPAQIEKLTPEARAEYVKQDEAWCAKELDITLTTAQEDIVVRSFKHWFDEAVKQGKVGPNTYLAEIITTFDIKTVA